MCPHTKQGRAAAAAAAAAGNTCVIACSDCDAVTSGGGHVQGDLLHAVCVVARVCGMNETNEMR